MAPPKNAELEMICINTGTLASLCLLWSTEEDMDPPEVIAERPRLRQRRGSRWVAWAFYFTIAFAVLSLLKLEPIARNSVSNDNSDPIIKETKLYSTADDPIQESNQSSSIVSDERIYSQHQSDTSTPLKQLDQCTPEQLKTIEMQLPPEDCLKYKSQPWMQRCSFTYASRCPDAIWLKDFYTQIHSETSASMKLQPPFVGIFIGCNKGFDAFNALRMGSGIKHFEKSNWRDAILKNVGGSSGLHHSVCGQDIELQFSLQENSPNDTTSDAILHCVEPMPQTYRVLNRSAVQLNITENFKVVNAAFSHKDGSVPFPKGGKVGVENKGIANCNGANDAACTNVKMYSLDTYVDENFSSNTTINYLSVDVEGYDSDVLLGGYRTALSRTQYLEFEYNWMGPWGKQKLSAIIPELENNFGFACYWPGTDGNIWRITKCFLDYYDIHFWSNVACVNRRIDEARYIAEKMENMFLDTLEKGDDAVVIGFDKIQKTTQYLG